MKNVLKPTDRFVAASLTLGVAWNTLQLSLKPQAPRYLEHSMGIQSEAATKALSCTYVGVRRHASDDLRKFVTPELFTMIR